MSALFTRTAHDISFYEKEIRDFLPETMVDIHTHIWLDAHKAHGSLEFDRVVSWPMLVAKENPVGDLVETYKILFPGKRVTPLIFSEVGPEDPIDTMNGYVAEAGAKQGYPSLLFARPEWTGAELAEKMRSGAFIGVKVYLNLSPPWIPREEIRIFDFLPPHQLHELNRLGALAMLHIPRSGRLADPVNTEQLMEIERNYPRVRLIVAHAGRAYCEADLGGALDVLEKSRHMVFDFSANTNSGVFAAFLAMFGPHRCLFGSDLPITRMRMKRICVQGRYVNLVPRDLYGDVSADSNMAELDPPLSDGLSFFLYEEIQAIKLACRKTGIDRAGVEAIFNGNGRRLLGG